MGILRCVRNSYGALKILYRLSGFLNLFCRRFDAQQNAELRARAALPSGLLNGQGRAPLAELPYGAWRMEKNGCEVIAAYNALLALERPTSFPKVAEELERKGLLFNGFGGTNPAALEGFFRRKSIDCRLLRRRDADSYSAALAEADCGILSYWTGKRLRRPDRRWNTLHTVFIRRAAAGVEICNAALSAEAPTRAESLSAFLQTEDADPVCLLLLRKSG